jgi:hypothetical protein
MDDYLDRDGLLALGLDEADVDKILRDAALTGHGDRPVVESTTLQDLLDMLSTAGGDDGQ